MEQALGRVDLRFLERSFQGLMLNFNCWLNRKDPAGRKSLCNCGGHKKTRPPYENRWDYSEP
ncbi:MAG: hypothetical protein HGB17_10700 [Syntrophobacteraceae bacterium]|nr:hypothetical protein [Syntrophobacteraceae bacterium]